MSEATQADYLTKAFTKMQSYPYVTAAFWYNIRNNWWLLDAPADLEANLGLLRTDFTAKPSYAALRSWTGASTATTTTTTVPATTTTTVAPTTDVTGPVLSDVRVVSARSTSAVVAWATNERSNSQVEDWAGPKPITTVADSGFVASHRVALSGLSPWTRYSYRVRSTDAAGNTTLSPIYSFKTIT